MMSPRHQPPPRIHGAGHVVIGGRAIEIVLHVIFASPHQLDWLPDNLCYLCSFDRKVGHVATPESSARKQRMNNNALWRDARDLRDRTLYPIGRLRWRPGLPLVSTGRDRDVHRLHGRVSEKRQLIDRLDAGQRIAGQLVNVSIVANYGARGFCLFLKRRRQGCTALIRMSAQVPINLECSTALHRCPRAVRNYCNTTRAVNILLNGFDLEYVLDALDCLRCRRVETLYLPAESSTAGNNCIKHSWDFRVQAKFRGAVG